MRRKTWTLVSLTVLVLCAAAELPRFAPAALRTLSTLELPSGLPTLSAPRVRAWPALAALAGTLAPEWNALDRLETPAGPRARSCATTRATLAPAPASRTPRAARPLASPPRPVVAALDASTVLASLALPDGTAAPIAFAALAALMLGALAFALARRRDPARVALGLVRRGRPADAIALRTRLPHDAVRLVVARAAGTRRGSRAREEAADRQKAPATPAAKRAPAGPRRAWAIR